MSCHCCGFWYCVCLVSQPSQNAGPSVFTDTKPASSRSTQKSLSMIIIESMTWLCLLKEPCVKYSNCGIQGNRERSTKVLGSLSNRKHACFDGLILRLRLFGLRTRAALPVCITNVPEKDPETLCRRSMLLPCSTGTRRLINQDYALTSYSEILHMIDSVKATLSFSVTALLIFYNVFH